MIRRTGLTMVVGMAAGLMLGGCPAAPVASDAPFDLAPAPMAGDEDAAARETSAVNTLVADAEEEQRRDEEEALLADCDGDGIPNWQALVLGRDPCDSNAPIDTDGDGVPNTRDSDIDNDGFANRLDPDIDGDGLPNGRDPDIDGDGVDNDDDDDVDGDFIRNELDLDIDGDGILNPFDDDDDADETPDEEESDEEDEPEEDDGGSSGDDEEEENAGDGPTAEEENEAWLAVIGDVFDQDLDEVLADLGALADLFNDEEEGRQAVTEIATDVLADGAETDRPQRSQSILAVRIDAASILTENVAPEDVRELTDSLDRLADAARELELQLSLLIDTANAIADVEETPDLSDVAETATTIMTTADQENVPAADVADVVDESARTAIELGGGAGIDAAFAITAKLIGESRATNDDGESDFSVLTVAQSVEAVAALLGDPDVQQLTESTRNILNSTADADLDDPIAVIRAVERAGGVADDGIDVDEAMAAATLVESETL